MSGGYFSHSADSQSFATRDVPGPARLHRVSGYVLAAGLAVIGISSSARAAARSGKAARK
jgi:hypothetical protein